MSSQVPTEFFAEASSGVLQLAERVSQLAGQFRSHDVKEANDGLALMTKDLGQFAAVVAALEGPLSIDPARLTVEGLSPDQQIARLANWLELLIEAQHGGDWLTIADILELDLEPLLRAWVPLLLECAPGSIQ
ncbi:MAG TPA: hypothetical protein VI485_11300 [Vicinamibacterales bacterium]|nr:hypothetical protein [Vicinamibacterales bacterium]